MLLKHGWHIQPCRALSTADDVESATAKVEPPTTGQLRQIFLASAIPFVGFGFMDNFVMIIAGDLIDTTLCVTFCLSTMAAAAVGNTLSDIVGIYTGSIIEQIAENNGIKEPPLDSEQRLLRITKFWQYTGQVVGIVFGCILGMCPLLFLDLGEAQRLKREKEMEEMLVEAMPDVKRIMKCEAVLLMAFKEEQEELQCLSATDNLPNVKPWSVNDGIMGHVAKTSRYVNIADVSQSQYYFAPMHDNFQGSQIRVRSILCVPVMQSEKTVGVLAAMNKEQGGSFTEKDEDKLSFIASHISVRMVHAMDVNHSFRDVMKSCEKVMAKQESIEYGSHTARQRRAELYLPALNGISRVLQAQATALMLADDEKAELYTEAIVGDLPKHKNLLGEGIAGRCALQGRIINVERNATAQKGNTHFDSERHDDYLGSGMTVRSELCVPMFDSGRKCLGVIKVINKQGGGAFTQDDVTFAVEVANNLAIMLEDDGGIKRVLSMVRQQIQHRQATIGEKADRNTVLCFLDRGQELPNDADFHGVGIDPYVTIQIVRGNPLTTTNLEDLAREARRKDRNAVVRRFGKSKTVMQNINPSWEETIAVTVPIEFRGVPEEELYAHVLLWDYDSWKQDDLIAQAAFPLSAMPKGKLKTVKPYHLQQIPGGRYNLEGSRLWLSFSRAGPRPLARALTPPPERIRRSAGDWAGDNFVPKVGQAAVDSFQSTDDWLAIVDAMRDRLVSSCGASFAEIESTRRQDEAVSIVCSVSDPGQTDCPLVYVSKAFEELTGYPSSFALGRNCRFLQPKTRSENDSANASDRAQMRKFIQGLMPENYVLWTIVLNETWQGRKFWNMLRMEFVHLGEEKKPYIFAVQRSFKREPEDLEEVSKMRALLEKHNREGTVPREVLASAGLGATSMADSAGQ